MLAHSFSATRCLGFLAIALALGFAQPARAWVDQNGDKTDDRIEAVHAGGWNAAFVDGDPTKRMRIGVENPAAIVHAVYVGYDHRQRPPIGSPSPPRA